MFKYRSMVAGDHTSRTPVNADGSLKINADDKVTRVGRLMRRLSLDELPQLINVILGDMSISGPRPELPIHVEAYDKETHTRLTVKPGLTGWAQIHGRNQLSLDERHCLDIDYVQNYSFFLDLKIILSTLPKLFSGKGVYQEKKSMINHSKVDLY